MPAEIPTGRGASLKSSAPNCRHNEQGFSECDRAGCLISSDRSNFVENSHTSVRQVTCREPGAGSRVRPCPRARRAPADAPTAVTRPGPRRGGRSYRCDARWPLEVKRGGEYYPSLRGRPRPGPGTRLGPGTTAPAPAPGPGTAPAPGPARTRSRRRRRRRCRRDSVGSVVTRSSRCLPSRCAMAQGHEPARRRCQCRAA